MMIMDTITESGKVPCEGATVMRQSGAQPGSFRAGFGFPFFGNQQGLLSVGHPVERCQDHEPCLWRHV
jgi:hypothetical protein